MTLGLRDVIRAIREYPTLSADLESARSELRQTQRSLEQREQECAQLGAEKSDTALRLRFCERKLAAFQSVLEMFCPKQTSLEEMKQLYGTISPGMDASGFTLYRTAKKLTGIDVHTFFPYEDNRGMFETMDGRQLLDCLIAARFDAVEWEIADGTGCEKAIFREVDTTTPEYQAFEHKLYRAVLARMGFEDILAPGQEVNAIEDKTTELKLYSPLFGELTEPEYDESEPLDSRDLAAFQDVILRGIEDEQMPEEEERGLMAYFDGSDAVNEKVVSLFPTVENVDGKLYAVAVCQINGTLTPGELDELKEYCHAQYNDAWGEGFAQRPRRTEYGDLYVSFYTDSSASILTKEEMETGRTPSRPSPQKRMRGDAR